MAQWLALSPHGKRRCPVPFCVTLVTCYCVCNGTSGCSGFQQVRNVRLWMLTEFGLAVSFSCHFGYDLFSHDSELKQQYYL